MRFSRDQLRYMAVMALDEISETCGKSPAAKSLMLRVILAYLFVETGARPELKRLFTDFWDYSTAAADPLRGQDAYIRSTGATSALNGICRELGWERTPSFMREMKARRQARE